MSENGTYDPEADFEVITGSEHDPFINKEGKKAEGMRVGPRKELFHPENSSGGVSIDIPAKGDRKEETLHYPKSQTDKPKEDKD